MAAPVHDYDVVVIGSGAAGLCAALSAGTRGSRVLVLEKSRLIGGTTAMSGGGIWVPCHHWLRSFQVYCRLSSSKLY